MSNEPEINADEDSANKTSDATPPVNSEAPPKGAASNAAGASPKPQTATGADPAAEAAPEPKKKAPMTSGKKMLIGAISCVVLVLAVIFGSHYLKYSRTHVSTDDATITGNLVQVGPLLSGTLTSLDVQEGSTVRKGQLLARLDSSGPLASLRQSEASYEVAETNIAQAKKTKDYESLSTNAAILKAQFSIAIKQSQVKSAQSQVRLTSGQTQTKVEEAEAELQHSRAQQTESDAQVVTYEAGLLSYQKAETAAERGVTSLQAKVGSAQADVDKYSRDEARYRKLLALTAVTQEQYDSASASVAAARSTLGSLIQQIAQSQSQVEEASANVKQSLGQLKAARASARSAYQQVVVSMASLAVARAGLAENGIRLNDRISDDIGVPQAGADLKSADAGLSQIALRLQQVKSAVQQAKQSKASLDNARITYEDTFIYAPADGTVVRKAVNSGASVSAGQTLFTMTQGNKMWATANFKETQITNVHIGQPVEVDVDAFPGKHFHGVVGSINEATGSATTLLPPDNSTGNFTKIVQRIPVKIAIIASGDSRDTSDASPQDIARLRQGMSITATIDTTDETDRPNKVPAGYDRYGSGKAAGAGQSAGTAGSNASASSGGSSGSSDMSGTAGATSGNNGSGSNVGSTGARSDGVSTGGSSTTPDAGVTSAVGNPTGGNVNAGPGSAGNSNGSSEGNNGAVGSANGSSGGASNASSSSGSVSASSGGGH